MEKPRKRKQLQLDPSAESRPKPSRATACLNKPISDPYATHPRPTPEECRALRDDLLAIHGFPQQFAKYRRERATSLDDETRRFLKSEPLDGDAQETVLEGLVKTVLSQNTTDVNSQRAFVSLKSAFPTWEDVLAAESKCIENAIRCGGLAPTKASCIKNILSCLLEKKGKLCLEYLRDLSVDEIKMELSQFKGIGPKTVFEIAKAIGWVPSIADRNKTYLHLNKKIPNELKFDLNCLLFTHGKLCHRCRKRVSREERKESSDSSCPLLNYCKNP